MKWKVALMVAAVAVAGCNPTYRRPTSTDVASVRFIALQPKGIQSGLSVYAHAGEECGTPKKIVGFGVLNKLGGGRTADRDIGMPKDPLVTYAPGQYFETTVPSGSRFNFSLAGGETGARLCYLSGSFLPMAGGEYEVSYRTDAHYCYMDIYKISVLGGALRRDIEPTAAQRREACTFFWN